MEIPALFGRPSKGVLTLLAPASHFSTAASGVPQVALLLLIEVGANVFVYAAMFSVLGLMFVAIRRMIKSKTPKD